jgi:hypothetical protein
MAPQDKHNQSEATGTQTKDTPASAGKPNAGEGQERGGARNPTPAGSGAPNMGTPAAR